MDMSNIGKNKKAFLLMGRCQHELTDEVEKNNDCFAIYTTPPPISDFLYKTENR
jgi:hypothetical protein